MAVGPNPGILGGEKCFDGRGATEVVRGNECSEKGRSHKRAHTYWGNVP